MSVKRFCTSCGKELAAESGFCDNCGARIENTSVPTSAGSSGRVDAGGDPDKPSPAGGGRRLLIAGAASIAIALALGGVWWGSRAPQVPQVTGGPQPGTTSAPEKAAASAPPGAAPAAQPAQKPAVAAVGRIDSLDGEVRITSASGERNAQPGAAVNEGDAIRTGANAWVLLEMTDGATITVRPGTQTRIETYRYLPDGAASENRSVIAIVNGALRVITGLIGRTNRQGYAVATPTATIGIRGTDHEPSYYPPGDAELAGQPPGTYDKVNAGETVVRTPRGEVAVRPGRSAFVHHDARVAPQLLTREPAFYRRHAEFDKPVAARRTEIHRRIERDQQLRPKPPAAVPEKGAKPQPRAGGAQPKSQQQLQQERLKEQEQKRAGEKGAKSQPKADGGPAKTPQQLQQERRKEQEEKRAEKGAKPQPKADGAQQKTPQQLREERRKEQEQKGGSEKGAKPQPKADAAQTKTPQQLQQEKKEMERRRTQQERDAAEAKAKKKQ